MNARTLVMLVVVAVLSAAATFLLTSGGDDSSSDDMTDSVGQSAPGSTQVVERFVTIEVPVTSTPDPNVIMITVTPAGDAVAAVPTIDAAAANDTADTDTDAGAEAEVTTEAGPEFAVTVEAVGLAESLDPALIDANGRFTGTQAELPTGCVLHTLADGEFPTLIIENYGLPAEASFTMLSINGLDDDTARFLQIGDQLVVPLEGCPVDQFLEAQGQAPQAVADADDADAEATEEATPEVTPDPNISPTPTVEPTITLAPTADGATVQIADVIGSGDLDTEGVEIVNNGNTIDISGWTLSDGDGNVYVFPDQRRLFSGASITVNTRPGDNTAILLFWGRDEAVFSEAGDVVVLANADGDVQSSLRLP